MRSVAICIVSQKTRYSEDVTFLVGQREIIRAGILGVGVVGRGHAASPGSGGASPYLRRITSVNSDAVGQVHDRPKERLRRRPGVAGICETVFP
jgi:hypothetical protein